MGVILSLLTIISYFINGKLGFLVSLCSIFILIFSKKEKMMVKILKLLIFSLPISYIGIFGMDFNHIFSWYNIFLLVYMIYIITINRKITKKSLITLIIIFVCLTLNLFWTKSYISSLIEILQLFMMLVPILWTFDSKEKCQLEKENIEKLLKFYISVTLSTAICMLLQFYLYYYRGIEVGYLMRSGLARVSFFCLFRGASVLPIFIGSGFLLLFIDTFYNKIKLSNIVYMIIMFGAIVFNTSRAAFFALLMIMAFIVLKDICKKKFSWKMLIMFVIIVIIGVWGIDYITSIRVQLTSFFDDNGRIEGILQALKIWGSNFKNILLGIGFDSDFWIKLRKPHNVIFQTLSQCGIIVSIILFILIGKFLLENKDNKYRYVFWFIIISGMFITDFYANTFTTIIFIILDLYNYYYYKSENLENVSDLINNEKIKVMHYIPGFNFGGIESRLIDWYSEMDRSKIEFVVIKSNNIDDSEKIKELQQLGGRFYNLPHFELKNVMLYMNKLNEIIKNEKPDVMHVHSLSTGIFPLYAAKKNNVKVRIIHSRTTSYLPKEKNVFIKKILKFFTCLYPTDYFACSKEAGIWAFGKRKLDQVRVIKNGINLPKFEFDENMRQKIRKKLKVENNIVIGTISRLSSQKNILYLLDIFSEIYSKNSNYRLVIVGSGDLYDSIVEKIEKQNLQDVITIIPSCSNVWDYYMAFDIFLGTSLYEGFGTTAIEAQAAGLPTIISTGFPETVEVTDYIKRIPLSESPKSWAKKILKIKLRKRSARDTKKIEKSGYSSKMIAKELQTFYTEKVGRIDDKNEKNKKNNI